MANYGPIQTCILITPKMLLCVAAALSVAPTRPSVRCRAPPVRANFFSNFMPKPQPSPADVYNPDLTCTPACLPASFEDIVAAASSGVAAALEAGLPAVEVEFPPVASANARGDGSAASERLVHDANAAFAARLAKECGGGGRRRVTMVGCTSGALSALGAGAFSLRDAVRSAPSAPYLYTHCTPLHATAPYIPSAPKTPSVPSVPSTPLLLLLRAGSATAASDVAICVAPFSDEQWDALEALGAAARHIRMQPGTHRVAAWRAGGPWRGSTAETAWVAGAAAHAASHRSGGPLAYAGLPSGPERRAPSSRGCRRNSALWRALWCLPNVAR